MSMATFRGEWDEKAKKMKQKRLKMKNQEEKEEADKKIRHVDGGVDKESSSKKKLKSAAARKTAVSNQHAVAKICSAAEQ